MVSIGYVFRFSRGWLETKRKSLSESTWNRNRDQLVKLVGPYLGNRPIGEIEAPELLGVLKRLEHKGIRGTSRRVRAVCGRVFRYGIATGRATRDISAAFKVASDLRSYCRSRSGRGTAARHRRLQRAIC